MISHPHPADIWANRFDNARAFMPVHYRRRMGYEALDVVEIAVAHPACNVANPDLVSFGLLQFEHLDLNALTGHVMDRRLDLHGHTIVMSKAEPKWPELTKRASARAYIPASGSGRRRPLKTQR